MRIHFFPISIDLHPHASDNDCMSTETPTTDTMVDDLEKSLKLAAMGERDPERMRRAIEAVEQNREETRKRIGTVDVAVDLIRDARDQ